MLVPEENTGMKRRSNGKKQSLMREINNRLIKLKEEGHIGEARMMGRANSVKLNVNDSHKHRRILERDIYICAFRDV